MSRAGYNLCNKERGEEYTHVFNCLCTKKNFRKNIYETVFPFFHTIGIPDYPSSGCPGFRVLVRVPLFGGLPGYGGFI